MHISSERETRGLINSNVHDTSIDEIIPEITPAMIASPKFQHTQSIFNLSLIHI